MKTTITGFMFVCMSVLCFGQYTSPEVLSAAGDHFGGASVQLSWTVGEIATETYNSSNKQITQGFHQSYLTIVKVVEYYDDFNLNVYPNPARHMLYIDLDKPAIDLSLTLYDGIGKPVFENSLDGIFNTEIDVSSLRPGLYYLHVINSSNRVNKTYKIIKAQ